MENRIKIIILISSLLYIIGGGYIFITSLSIKSDIAMGPSIEAIVTLSSPTLTVTQDASDRNTSNTVILTTKVTNNAPSTLTGVKLVIPIDTAVDTLETLSAKRITNLPGQGTDAVFSLPDLPSKTATQSQVLLYTMKKGTYKIKPYISSNEKYIGIIDPVTLSAE